MFFHMMSDSLQRIANDHTATAGERCHEGADLHARRRDRPRKYRGGERSDLTIHLYTEQLTFSLGQHPH